LCFPEDLESYNFISFKSSVHAGECSGYGLQYGLTVVFTFDKSVIYLNVR